MTTTRLKTVCPLNAFIAAVLIIGMAAPLLPPLPAGAEEEGGLTEPGVPEVMTEGESGSQTAGITGAGSCLTQAGAAAATIGATQVAPGAPVADAGARISQFLTTGGTIINCVGTFFNFIKNTITASGITYLVSKSQLDAIATGILKSAITATRNMVIRWIMTGRFDGPVFSASFALDLQRSLENASRTFLGQLTGINFCQGISVPPQALFAANINVALACTFNGNLADFRSGRVFDFVSLYSSEAGANEAWNAAVKTMDQKMQYEEIARRSFEAEYQAGQGYLNIRDAATGLAKTPASYVRTLVEQTQIIGPDNAAQVANTVQQAIGAIITTAIQVSIERGLAGAFGASQ